MSGVENWLRARPIKAVLVFLVLMTLRVAAREEIGGIGGFVLSILVGGAGVLLFATLFRVWSRGARR